MTLQVSACAGVQTADAATPADSVRVDSQFSHLIPGPGLRLPKFRPLVLPYPDASVPVMGCAA